MAAANATTSVNQVDTVRLRFFVDKERNKVLYAEAGKDFVDVLFSFLTLPLGTIARLVAKKSNIEAVRVGSLSSLYQSVIDLDEQYLWTPTCKEMLLNPRNSMEDYCKNLKLNIDDTDPLQYFRCESWNCNRLDSGCRISTFRNQKCSCGKVMNTPVSPESLILDNGFVMDTATFVISDDLCVMPNVFGTIVRLLQKLGVKNGDTIKEHTVDISKTEVTDLLKLSLLSKTPLTNFIFKNHQFLSNSNLRFEKVVASDDDGRLMDLKVTIRKSNGEILFAEAEEDFADFLFSFLSFPLGGVLNMLEEFSFVGCLDNLYGSMKELSPDRYFISKDHKDKLTKPHIAPQFDLTNQILPISSSSLPVKYCYTYNSNNLFVVLSKDMVYPTYSSYQNLYNRKYVVFNLVDPKSSSKTRSFGQFVKGPSAIMVTDDLVVTPMSSAPGMSYLNRFKVPLFDLEEKVIKIGIKEGLAILKASLISTTALTTGLNQFIGTNEDPVKKERTIKQES